MNADGNNLSETKTGIFKLLAYVFMWIFCNLALILFLISCWKFGPLSTRGEIMFLAVLHLAVLMGMHKLHATYFKFVKELGKMGSESIFDRFPKRNLPKADHQE